jgi:hypothetical protein
MKHTFLILFTMSLLSLYACVEGEKKQDVEVKTPEEVKKETEEIPDAFDAEFTDGMVGKVFQNYLEVHTSLVNSDLEEAKNAASNLAEAFGQEQAELKQAAQSMAEADNLDVFRTSFSRFTTLVEPLLKESVSQGTIYKQYCPMAFDDKGAYWFSDAEEIRNPYFGDEMLTCGNVEETITKK